MYTKIKNLSFTHAVTLIRQLYPTELRHSYVESRAASGAEAKQKFEHVCLCVWVYFDIRVNTQTQNPEGTKNILYKVFFVYLIKKCLKIF